MCSGHLLFFFGGLANVFECFWWNPSSVKSQGEKICDHHKGRHIGGKIAFLLVKARVSLQGLNLTARWVMLKTYCRQLVQDREESLDSTRQGVGCLLWHLAVAVFWRKSDDGVSLSFLKEHFWGVISWAVLHDLQFHSFLLV